ncbi:MAG: hypothetical protein WCP70_09585 [Methanothrix sp.]
MAGDELKAAVQQLSPLIELADRVIRIYGEQTKSRAKAAAKMPGARERCRLSPVAGGSAW